MAQELGEPVDARIPEALVAAEPIVGPLEGPRIDAAVVNASTHGAFHQSHLLERLDVLRCGGERHAIGRSELTHCVLPFRKPLEHRAPRPVAECVEEAVESGLLINHVVEYISGRAIVNHEVEDQRVAAGASRGPAQDSAGVSRQLPMLDTTLLALQLIP